MCNKMPDAMLGGLHCSPLVAGIVICLLTGLPKPVIRANLIKRGSNPHFIEHAERCVDVMLRWGMVPDLMVQAPSK